MSNLVTSDSPVDTVFSSEMKMAAKPEDMLEHCEECGSELEVGKIGMCDECQAAAQQGISEEQAATAARLTYESAEAGWSARAANGLRTECVIESTNIFEALSRLSLPCTDVAEGQVEDALDDLGYYTKAAEAFKAFQASS